MNLILFNDDEIVSGIPEKYLIRLKGYQLEHVRDILKSKVGGELRVGKKDGRMGIGLIKSINREEVLIEVYLKNNPPPKIPLILALALPRPLFLRRILSSATSMGIEGFVIFHSLRVEKSYWRSPVLSLANLNEAVQNGLEQSQDTIYPSVILKKTFNSFAEEFLSPKKYPVFVAHPHAGMEKHLCPPKALLVIGPEGGFVKTEIEAFERYGCRFFDLGQRILKVETAVVSAITKLCL